MHKKTTYFQKIARAFARNYGIRVLFEGTGASYDLKNQIVRIPMTVDALDGDLRKVYEGLLDHEALGHAYAETDCKERGVKLPSQIVNERLYSFQPNRSVWMYIFNAIEDARIERVAIQKWPGTEYNLRHCAEWALNLSREKYEADPSSVSPWYFVGVGIYAYARGVSHLIQWFPQEALEMIEEHFAAEIQATKNAINPEDCEVIADRILAKIEDLKPEEPEQQPEEQPEEQPEDGQGQQQEQDGGQGQDGGEDGGVPDCQGGSNESGDSGPSDDVSSDEGAEGQDSEEDAENVDSEGAQGEGSADGQGSGSNNVQGLSDSFASELEKHITDTMLDGFHHEAMRDIERQAAVAHVEDLTRVAAPHYVKSHDKTRRWEQLKHKQPERWAKIRSTSQSLVGGLSQRVAALLKTTTKKSRGDQDRGRIDSRSLSGLKVGNRDVFRQTRSQIDTDTAVSILVDMSGPMAGGKSWQAAKAAFVLGEALHRAGVPFELRGFHTDGRHPSTLYAVKKAEAALVKGSPIHNRFEPLIDEEVKTFSDSWSRRSKFVTQIVDNTGGCNNDPASLELAAVRLLQRSERRKLIFVLSDGQPVETAFQWKEGQSCRERGRDLLIAKLEQIESAGVEVAAIGIGTDYVDGIYRHAAHVKEVSELPTKAVGLLKGLLVKNRRAA